MSLLGHSTKDALAGVKGTSGTAVALEAKYGGEVKGKVSADLASLDIMGVSDGATIEDTVNAELLYGRCVERASRPPPLEKEKDEFDPEVFRLLYAARRKAFEDFPPEQRIGIFCAAFCGDDDVRIDERCHVRAARYTDTLDPKISASDSFEVLFGYTMNSVLRIFKLDNPPLGPYVEPNDRPLANKAAAVCYYIGQRIRASPLHQGQVVLYKDLSDASQYEEHTKLVQRARASLGQGDGHYGTAYSDGYVESEFEYIDPDDDQDLYDETEGGFSGWAKNIFNKLMSVAGVYKLVEWARELAAYMKTGGLVSSLALFFGKIFNWLKEHLLPLLKGGLKVLGLAMAVIAASSFRHYLEEHGGDSLTADIMIKVVSFTQMALYVLGGLGIIENIDTISDSISRFYRHTRKAWVEGSREVRDSFTEWTRQAADRDNLARARAGSSIFSFVFILFRSAISRSKAALTEVEMSDIVHRSKTVGEVARVGLTSFYTICTALPASIQEHMILCGILQGTDVFTEHEQSVISTAEALCNACDAVPSMLARPDTSKEVVAVSETVKIIADRTAPRLTVGGPLRNALTRLQARLTKFARVATVAHSGTSRVPAYGIWLEGDTAIGKSTLLAALAKTLGNHSIYCMNGRMAHFDGYCGQHVLCIDEWPNEKEAEADLVANLMQMISCADYRLPMASLEDKGMFFTSKYIIVCANKSMSSTFAGVVSQAAFKRRFTNYRVDLDPAYAKEDEFGNRVLDPATLDVKKLGPLAAERYPHLSFTKRVFNRDDSKHSQFKNIETKDLLALTIDAMVGQAMYVKTQTDTDRASEIFSVHANRRLHDLGKGKLASLTEKEVTELESAILKKKTELREQYKRESKSNGGAIVSPQADDSKEAVDPSILRFFKMREDEKKRVRDEWAELGPKYLAVFRNNQLVDFVAAHVSGGVSAIVDGLASRKAAPFLIPPAHRTQADKRLEERLDRAIAAHQAVDARDRLAIVDDYRTRRDVRYRHPKIGHAWHERGTVMGRVKSTLKVVAAILGTVGGAVGLYFGGKAAYDYCYVGDESGDERLDENVVLEDDVLRQSQDRRAPRRSQRIGRSEFKPAALTTTASGNTIKNILGSNCAEITLRWDGKIRTLKALVYKSGHLLTPFHLFMAEEGRDDPFIPEGSRMDIRVGSCTHHVVFKRANVRLPTTYDPNADMQEDIVTYLCPAVVAKDISSKFVSLDDMETIVRDFDRAMVVRFSETKPPIVPMSTMRLYKKRMHWESTDRKLQVGAQSFLEYANLDEGDCGSIMMVERQGVAHIVGMHIATRRKTPGAYPLGCSMVLDKKLATGMRKPFTLPPIVERQSATLYTDRIEDMPPGKPGVFVPKGRLLDVASMSNGGTKIRPSLVHDDIKQPFAIANLGDKEMSAQEIALKDWAATEPTPPDIDSLDLQVSGDAIVDRLLTEVRSADLPIRVLSNSEAINGSPDIKGLGAIDRSTSAGYPYTNLVPPGTGKKTLLVGAPGARVMASSVLSHNVADAWDQLVEGPMKPEDLIGTLCLKDEVRPLAKVKARKTRTISVLPLHFTIVGRRLLGAFIGSQQTTLNVGKESAVGMNVYSAAWGSMIDDASLFGSQGFDGDYGKFEQYFRGDVKKETIRIFVDFHRRMGYSEEDLARIANWFESFARLYQRVGRDVFQQLDANPSGVFGTTIINNVVNSLLLRCAFRRAYRHAHDGHDIAAKAFDRYVWDRLYGDDHIVVPRAHITGWFNLHTVGAAMETFGVVYTSADKKPIAESPMLTPLNQLSFLGNVTNRIVVKGRRRLVAQPGLIDIGNGPETVKKCLMFDKKGLDPRLALAEKINQHLRRHFGLGRQRFMLERKMLIELAKPYVAVDAITYEECEELFELGTLYDPDDEQLTGYPLFEDEAVLLNGRESGDYVVVDGQVLLVQGTHRASSRGDGDGVGFRRQGLTISTKNVKAAAGSTVDFSDSSSQSAKGKVDANLDAPCINHESVPVQKRMPVLASGTGVAFNDNLMLRPSEVAAPMSAQVRHSVPETLLSHIKSKPTLLRQFTVSTDRPAGWALTLGRLSPMDGYNDLITRPNLMQYVGALAEYWSGGLDFTIMIVGTSLHKLRLAFVPNYGSDVFPIAVEDQLSQYAMVIDYDADRPVTKIRVPWRSISERLRTHSPRTAESWESFAMGFWQLVVINPLRAPETVAQEVDVYMFISGAPDFKLWYPAFGTMTTHPERVPEPAVERKPLVKQPMRVRRIEEAKAPMVQQEFKRQSLDMKDGDGDMDTGAGILFQEAEEKSHTFGGREPGPEMDNAANAERQMGFTDVLKRAQLFSTFVWNTTQTADTVLGQWNLPFDAVNTPLLQSVFNAWTYFRGDVTIRLAMQSNFFQQGALIMYFTPLTDTVEALDTHQNSRVSQTVTPHAFLTASGSAHVELTIPFYHFLRQLNIRDIADLNNSMGALTVSVWSPLKTGAGAVGEALEAQISMFISFSNLQLKVVSPVPHFTLLDSRSVEYEEEVTRTGRRRRLETAMGEFQRQSATSVDNKCSLMEAPLFVVAPLEEAPSANPPMDELEDLTDLVKRYSPLRDFVTGFYGLGLPLITLSNTQRTHLNYIGAMFRTYRGGLRFRAPMHGGATYSFFPNADFDMTGNPPHLLASGTVSGPLGAVPPEYGVTNVQVPFISKYHLLKVPKRLSDLAKVEYTLGALNATVASPDASYGSLYCAGADDFRFSGLYRVPVVVHDLTPG